MTIPPSPLAGQLPLLELEWAQFEKFCRALVSRQQGVEHSYLEGSQGDAQQGIDIVATRTDGATWAFQCKRVNAFTRADFRRVVDAATFPADHYVLLLASSATQAVREEARQHPKWEVWDANEIAERVRRLPAVSARSLVDTYFGPGWRHRFLGRPGPAPFVSADENFGALMDPADLFHHGWTVIGRGDTLDALQEFAASPDRRVAILAGRGGIGKSKVLHAFARAAEHKDTQVRFTVSGVPLTAAALDELEPGCGLVVVDDAHARDDLPALFAAARQSFAKVKLVLATRPYARDGIHAALFRARFGQSEIFELPELRELTPGETESLAVEALGPDYAHLAGVLGTFSGDSPLVTVLSAQLIRRDQLDPRLLSQQHEVRRIVLNAFEDALVGQVGEGADPDICKAVLRLASAIGPFRSDLSEVQSAAGAFLEVRSDQLHDALRALETAGVLQRRGRMLRVTPDVLADYILEDACLDDRGVSKNYAERVHECFRDAAPAALLRNLAELDWRRSRAGAAAGGERLLRGIWEEMEAEFRDAGVGRRAAMIRGLGVVAYYQPGPALRLVRMAQAAPAIWAGPGEAQALARVVPPVVGAIAYNLDYTEECCDLLWRLARDQPLNPLDPQDPLSVLHELAGYRLHKPLEVQHAVITAVERWVAEPDAHQHLLSPLDILTPVLAKTALTPGGEPLFLLPEPTAALRERALAIVAAAARQEDVRVARRAVQSLGYVLDEPIRPGGHALPDGFEALWHPYRARALAVVAELCAAPAHPLVHLACLEQLSRHVERGGEDPLAKAIRAAFTCVERSFELRFTELLLRDDVSAVYAVPPWADRPAGPDPWEREDAARRETTADFLALYPDAADGLSRIASRMETIEALAIHPMETAASSRAIAEYLSELDPDYTADLCECVVLGPPSLLLSHLPPWLGWMRQTRPDRYLSLARQILDVGGGLECAALAATLFDLGGPSLDGADELLARALTHPDTQVRWQALPALWLLAGRNSERATELALTVDLGRSVKLAERFADTFSPEHADTDALSPSVWDALLEKLVRVEHLDIASVYRLLDSAARASPRGVVQMLCARIHHAAEGAASYRPLPSVRPEALAGFLTAPDHEQMLREIRDFFLQAPAAEAGWMPWLYSLVSAGYGDAGLGVLREWIDGGGAPGVLAACELFRVVSPEFLLRRPDFVQTLLARADTAGPNVLDPVRTTLLDVVHRVAAEATEAGMPGSLWPPLVQLQEKGQDLSNNHGLHRVAREFYREVARLAEEYLRQARDTDEERLP